MAYQILHTAKVVQCDETGKLGFLINGKVYEGGGASSWNDLADRPFYSEYEVKPCVTFGGGFEITNVEIEFEGGDSNISSVIGYEDGFLQEDTSYFVTWDGVEYVCDSYYDDYDAGPAIGGSGYPFKIVYYDCWYTKAYALTPDGAEDTSNAKHTLSVAVKAESPVKIPNKYLPEEVLTKPDWDVDSNVEPGYIENRPFYSSFYEGAVIQTAAGRYINSIQVTFYDDGSDNLKDVLGTGDENLFGAEEEWYYIYLDDGSGEFGFMSINDGTGGAWVTLDNGIELYIRRTCNENPHHMSITAYASSGDYLTGTHTLTIRKRVENIQKLDAKFLPKAAAVADVTATPTAAQFNALLKSLRDAGYLAN